MSDKKTTNSRRRLLKSAMIGGGVLGASQDKWSRPIIDSVVLPAHATTTGSGAAPGGGAAPAAPTPTSKTISASDLNQTKIDYDIS